jgi:aconitase B
MLEAYQNHVAERAAEGIPHCRWMRNKPLI